MLTRPLTLNDSEDRGRGLVAVTSHPALPLADDDDDDETQTGVFSPPAPPWSSSSSSSSPSSPPPSLCVSSAPSLTPCPSFFSSSSPFTPPPAPPLRVCPPPPLSSTCFLTPPLPLPSPPTSSVCPPLPVAPLLSSAPSIHHPPLPPFVFFTPPSSLISSLSSSSPPALPSLLAPSPPRVSSSPFISPAPPVYCSSSAPCFPPSPLPSSSSSHPIPPSLHSSPPSFLPLHSVCTPPPPSPPPSTCPPPPPPPSWSPTAPSPLPPAPPPPCCTCSSLLPRLLSAHRLEVRRLLRGALASIGRRLDSLERRSRRKTRKKRSRQRGEEKEEEAGAACSPGSAVFPFSSASSCSPAHLPPVTTSSSSSCSSSDCEDSATPPLSSMSQSAQKSRRRSRGEEEGEGRGRKRRRNHRGRGRVFFPENREEEEEEEEDAGRFVGRMAVSFRGGAEEEEAPLTLHNFNHRKHRRRERQGTGQSEKAVNVVRQNGYRAPLLLHNISSSSSQNALHLMQSAQIGRTCSQSEAFSVSSGQWRFSDSNPPLRLSSNHSTFHLWLCSSSSSSSFISPASTLRLSAFAVETVSESVRGGACWSPLRPLRDWTAPPSLSSDHCYVRLPTPSPTLSGRRHQKQRANHSSRSLHLPRRRPLPLPSCSANGLSAPLTAGQSAAGSEFLSKNRERGKRVSQIRIRRASPRETPLTPMGLPKVKRLKKKEFSLEEIYTNKNYKSPTTNRSLETIFEEPREKDGALLLIGQQRRRRFLLFPDFTQPRKRKRPQGPGLPVPTVPRKRAAARRHCHGGGHDDESDLDVMLVERLSALEDFLIRQGLDV